MDEHSIVTNICYIYHTQWIASYTNGRLAQAGCRGIGMQVFQKTTCARGEQRQSRIKIQLAPNNDTGWHHLVAGGGGRGVQTAPWGEIVQGKTAQP